MDVSISCCKSCDNKKDEKNLFFNAPTITGIALFIIGLVGEFVAEFDLAIEFAIFAAAYILLAQNVWAKMIENLKKREFFDENFLMCIATIGAFAIGEFPEGVAVMLFYKIGESVQESAVRKSKKTISALLDIRQDYANLIGENGIEKVGLDKVKVGDKIVVKPGEKIPLDCVVVQGTSTLDASALTGESLPKTVEKGDTVLSGSVNLDGLLTLSVEKTQKDSTVAKILDLVQNSLARKTATEKFITKFAKIYTPTVLAMAFIMAFVVPFFVVEANFFDWIRRALVFLVVSCPCALVVSVPLGYFGGITCASKHGILIKGSNFLDALNKVKAVIFDKTGTLTEGKFSVEEVVSTSEFSQDELLKFAAYAEYYSNHPIAKSIVAHYEETGESLEVDKISDYKETAGKGVCVSYRGKKIAVGNLAFLKEFGVEAGDISQNGAVFFIAINGNFAGYITLGDKLKSDSAATIEKLRKMKIFTAVLTGDSKRNSANMAEKLNADLFFSDLLPQDKVECALKIKNEQKNFAKTAFLGDGINDSPVIAVSDVGVAMGGAGSDAAVEIADVVFMSDEPSKIITALAIARRTRKIVMQNIVFILAVKAVILVLGALGFATIWMAVIGDVGVTLAAVFNSLRTLVLKKEEVSHFSCGK